MTNEELDKIKSYATLLVSGLHQVVFDEYSYSRLKDVLRLAEEFECEVMTLERKNRERDSNIFKLRRIA
jgi:hypothetical protein